MTNKRPEPKLKFFQDWLSRWWQVCLEYPFMTSTRFYRTRQEALAAFYRGEVRSPRERGREIDPDLYDKALKETPHE